MEAMPLTVYVDLYEGFSLTCEAYPEDSEGKPCAITFPIRSENPGERWTAVENAINHVLTHIPGWENSRF